MGARSRSRTARRAGCARPSRSPDEGSDATATRALVTGANGHLGRTLIPALLEAGYRVRASVRDVSDRGRTAHLRDLDPDGIVPLDTHDGPAFRAATEGVDLIFHVAATCRHHSRRRSEAAALAAARAARPAGSGNDVKRSLYRIVTTPRSCRDSAGSRPPEHKRSISEMHRLRTVTILALAAATLASAADAATRTVTFDVRVDTLDITGTPDVGLGAVAAGTVLSGRYTFDDDPVRRSTNSFFSTFDGGILAFDLPSDGTRAIGGTTIVQEAPGGLQEGTRVFARTTDQPAPLDAVSGRTFTIEEAFLFAPPLFADHTVFDADAFVAGLSGASFRYGFDRYEVTLTSGSGYNSTLTDGASLSGTVSNVSLAPVPLPSAAWLMLAGLGALGAVRRRRTADLSPSMEGERITA